MSELVEFSYTEFPVKALPSAKRTILIARPLIPLTIVYKDRFVQYQALLDTGADYNVFHADIAEYLGIKLTKGKAMRIIGIGGDSLKGYQHQVSIKVGKNLVKTSIIFSRNIPSNATAVLGNQGFFNHFQVTFNYKDKIITLK
jgi:predicted aspartyl protease